MRTRDLSLNVARSPEQDREYTVAKIYALGIPARLAKRSAAR